MRILTRPVRNQQSLLLVFVLFGLGACITNSEVGKFYPASDDGGGPPLTIGPDGGGGGSSSPAGDDPDASATIKSDPKPLAPSQSRIAAGALSTCAIASSGQVACWGDNTHGQLGVGSSSIAASEAPLVVPDLDIGIDAVFGGSFAHCALKKDGHAVCWGDSDYQTAPTGQVMRAETAYAPKATPALPAVASVAIGTYFQCALTLDKGAKCYGQNSVGQLGNRTHDDSASPVDVSGLRGPVRAIAASQAGYFACAITQAGALQCWGSNQHGQLGTGVTGDASAASDVTGLGSGVTAVAAGSDHVCAAVSGTVLCWGSNTNGQLGDNSTTARTTPTKVNGLPSNVVALTAGTSHTCALTRVGSVYCWGNYDNRTGSLTHVQVIDSNVTEIAAGSYHTCALFSNDVLFCWGNDDYYQLGPYYNQQRGYPL